MNIAGYIQTTLLDWPGKIAAEIWTNGCNFRCPFCHNKDLVLLNPELSNKIAEKDVINNLTKRKAWIDGLVITGGEPTIQPDLISFCKKIKDLGLKVKLDTNGSNPDIIQKLIDQKLIDCVSMDIKTVFEEYDKANGINKNLAYITSKMKKSIGIILQNYKRSSIEYEFRTTIVPGVHNVKNLMQLAKSLKALAKDQNLKSNSILWTLQKFRPSNCVDTKFNKVKPLSNAQVTKYKKEIAKVIPRVKVR